MNILVLNVGSSTIKYALYVGEERAFGNTLSVGKRSMCKSYEQGIQQIMGTIQKHGAELHAIAHRIVHGGKLTKPCLLTPVTVKYLSSIGHLAPLHNIPELSVVRYCAKRFVVPQIGVFDTAFHTTIPLYASTYALPGTLTKRFGIRRYGFHGTSHQDAAQRACSLFGWNIKKKNMITCHLGNGCSITAIAHGKSIDTSMGFTPLEGVMMGTRTGSIDPGIILFLLEQGYPRKKIELLLNHESGLLGVSGVSYDTHVLIKKRKNPKVKLALEMFSYSIAKQIGSYLAALNGADAIVFTGGIGEHVPFVREAVMKRLAFAGLKYDRNGNRRNKVILSSRASKIKACIIPADEEKAIMQEARNVLGKRYI